MSGHFLHLALSFLCRVKCYPLHCVFEVTRHRKGWLRTKDFQPPMVYVDVLHTTVEFGDQASKEDTELT